MSSLIQWTIPTLTTGLIRQRNSESVATGRIFSNEKMKWKEKRSFSSRCLKKRHWVETPIKLLCLLRLSLNLAVWLLQNKNQLLFQKQNLIHRLFSPNGLRARRSLFFLARRGYKRQLKRTHQKSNNSLTKQSMTQWQICTHLWVQTANLGFLSTVTCSFQVRINWRDKEQTNKEAKLPNQLSGNNRQVFIIQRKNLKLTSRNNQHYYRSTSVSLATECW